MPVKVRCPSCRKVLKAPDRARGKAIKCPQCETKVRVPGGASKSGKSKSQRASSDDDDGRFLAQLDLRHAEDANVRICPKCATEIEDDDDVECPSCGVDLVTGILSDEMRKMRARQGPDPSGYYGRVWGDAWEFLGANKSLVIRTIFIESLAILISLFCQFMSVWCHHLPPKMFWGFFSLVSFMVAPGWIWFLTTEIVRNTLNKRKRVKKVHTDFFLNSALGVKFFLWLSIFTIPIHVVTGIAAGIFWALDYHIVSFSLIGAGFLLGLPFIPVVMAHMSMPIMRNAWWLPRMMQAFSRNPGQTLYWMLPAIVTLIIPVTLFGLNNWLFQDRYEAVYRYSQVIALSSEIENISPKANLEGQKYKLALEEKLDVALANYLYLVNDQLAKFDNDRNQMIATQLMADIYIRDEEGKIIDRYRKKDLWTFSDYFEVQWLLNKFMLVSAALLMLATTLFSIAAVFIMRTCGLYAYYCRDELDLVPVIPEVVYEPKSEDGKAPKKPLPPIVFVLVPMVLIFIAGYVLGGSYYETLNGPDIINVPDETYGAVVGIVSAGNLATVAGIVMLIVAGVWQFIADRNTDFTYEEKNETEDKVMTLVILGQTVVGLSFLYYIAGMVLFSFHAGYWGNEIYLTPFFWFMYLF